MSNEVIPERRRDVPTTPKVARSGNVVVGAVLAVGLLFVGGIYQLNRSGNERRAIAVASFCADELAARRGDFLGDVIAGAVIKDDGAVKRAADELSQLRSALRHVCEPLLPDHARKQLEQVELELVPITKPKGSP